ncbi:MAG: proteasome-type protease [Caulobacterales bacterium]|nr:proteasome-type protease [Caulobacterales bacterium]
MTYCVGLRLNEGLVLLSDTRTNAGVDDISTYRKMFTWANPGERAVAMMTAGNLAITQAVISKLQNDIDAAEPGSNTLMTARNMFGVVELVGAAMREVQQRYGAGLAAMNESSAASIVVSGHVRGGRPRLFLVYAAGNFIEASDDQCFFQIGEHKYGKPILDRVVNPQTPLEEGVTAALLSMDSTMRSNLTVGMPFDLAVIRADTFAFEQNRRIEVDDPNFRDLSNAWSDALRRAFADLRTIRV